MEDLDIKYICKSVDENIKDKGYKILDYAKAYALENKTNIYDAVSGEILYTYKGIKEDVDRYAEETLKDIDDLKSEITKDAKDEYEKDSVIVKDHISKDVDTITNKANEGLDYAQKKSNKFIDIIRNFINKIKSIFVKQIIRRGLD